MNRNVKFSYILLLLIFFTKSLFIQAQQSGKELFNEDWTFYKGNMEIEKANGDEVDWREVKVPHDWSVEGPFSSEWASGTSYLSGGIGWYRKDFDIKNYDDNKRYAIYFDGIYKNSEVWINGHYLGGPTASSPFNMTLYLTLKSLVM